MRSTITKLVASTLLGAAAIGATSASASALPAIQAARETGRLAAPQYECWDWTNEDGTTGTECRAVR
jgi:hypothetical protein